MKVTDYRIVIGTCERFTAAVREALSIGWCLHGETIHSKYKDTYGAWKDLYHQPMVKY